MTKEQAIAAFFQYNRIDAAHLSQYMDPKLERLEETVDLWLSDVDAGDRELFLRMLSRYTYLTNQAAVLRYREGVSMLEECLDAQGISIQDALFITVEAKDAFKSGSEHVRTDLHRLTIDRIDAQQIVSAASKLPEECLSHCRALVIVDDIIGTGFTVWTTIRTLVERFPAAASLPLFLLCTVPTRRGLTHLSKEAGRRRLSLTPLFREEWVAVPAFQHPEIFTSEERPGALARIRKYESLIDSYLKEDPERTYVLGFYGCRQLVSFYYNTPNNTLCTFWRWTDTHTPLFPREKQPQRPRLRDLQAVKGRKDRCAYHIQAEQRLRQDERS